jgi:type I site-specific restriction-modification system R (restriction) subunit
MLIYLQEALESPTIVVITDRNDLDDSFTDNSPAARTSSGKHRNTLKAARI